MLEEKLRELAQSNRYPFHMPGHKRMLDGTNPYAIDITEIEDFDNLHHAEGIIKDAEDAAAKMYGAKKAYYLVNGSTCGILAAISASVKRGGKILVARNCHKSVYHAIELLGLDPVYIYPEVDEDGNEIEAEKVEVTVKVTSAGTEDTVYKKKVGKDTENINLTVQGVGTITVKVYVSGILERQTQMNLNDSNAVWTAE